MLEFVFFIFFVEWEFYLSINYEWLVKNRKLELEVVFRFSEL